MTGVGLRPRTFHVLQRKLGAINKNGRVTKILLTSTEEDAIITPEKMRQSRLGVE